MKTSDFPYSLYLVASLQACKGRDLLKVAEAAIKGGVELIQLREKEMNTVEYLHTAYHLMELTDKYHIPLIINDNLEVARRSNAHGIHVGNNDLPPLEIRSSWKGCKILGYSVEDL